MLMISFCLQSSKAFKIFLLFPLVEIPIKTSQNQEIVISLVEKIIKAKKDGIDSSILEKSLDIVVYHLYNLSYNEVLIVDPETPITREEYEK